MSLFLCGRLQIRIGQKDKGANAAKCQVNLIMVYCFCFIYPSFGHVKYVNET